MVLKERLTALNAKVRWQSSERQFADGLTKFAARQLLADRLRCGELMLVWDPHFTAAKKKTAEERRASAAALAKAKAKALAQPTGALALMLATTIPGASASLPAASASSPVPDAAQALLKSQAETVAKLETERQAL